MEVKLLYQINGFRLAGAVRFRANYSLIGQRCYVGREGRVQDPGADECGHHQVWGLQDIRTGRGEDPALPSRYPGGP